jgi:hypothetical protein
MLAPNSGDRLAAPSGSILIFLSGYVKPVWALALWKIALLSEFISQLSSAPLASKQKTFNIFGTEARRLAGHAGDAFSLES